MRGRAKLWRSNETESFPFQVPMIRVEDLSSFYTYPDAEFEGLKMPQFQEKFEIVPDFCSTLTCLGS
jgi:hypothetical protein